MDKEKEFLKSLKRYTREQKKNSRPQFEKVDVPKTKYNRQHEKLYVKQSLDKEEEDYHGYY